MLPLYPPCLPNIMNAHDNIQKFHGITEITENENMHKLLVFFRCFHYFLVVWHNLKGIFRETEIFPGLC